MLELTLYEVLLTLRENLSAMSQLSTPSSSLFTVAWTFLMSLSDAKTVVSSAKWTKRIWFEDLYMHWYTKEKVLAQHRPLRSVRVWHSVTAVFDWNILFPVTEIGLKPAQHDTSDAFMPDLTHKYVMINCVQLMLLRNQDIQQWCSAWCLTMNKHNQEIQ